MSLLLRSIRQAGIALSLALYAEAAPAASYRVALMDDRPVTGGFINEAGEVAGTTWVDGHSRAFLHRGGVHVGSIWRHERQLALRWSRSGRPSELGILDGGESYATAINHAGVIVCAATVASNGKYHAIRHDGVGLQDLGTLVAGQASYALAINWHGDIVGPADLSDTAQHAVRFTDAGIVDLGRLGGELSVARALNDQGDVVGESTFGHPEHPWHTRAFLVRDGHMHSLPSLLRPEDRALWQLTSAYSINNAGQIVARARQAGSRF